MKNVIEINDLHFSYNRKRKILNGVNLTVQKGDIIAIVGLSGSGKSTLCYTMCGIIPYVYKGYMSGDIILYGKSTKEMKQHDIATKVGIVFQDPDTQLFSPTVEDEVAFGPENLCLSREEIGKRIEQSLSKVGMGKFRYENPNNLSGGQKQLIAIASVLSLNPDILIFDEIMSQIDKEGKEKIRKLIKELKGEEKTIIMIEHELNNLHLADRTLLLTKGTLESYNDRL